MMNAVVHQLMCAFLLKGNVHVSCLNVCVCTCVMSECVCVFVHVSYRNVCVCLYMCVYYPTERKYICVVVCMSVYAILQKRMTHV